MVGTGRDKYVVRKLTERERVVGRLFMYADVSRAVSLFRKSSLQRVLCGSILVFLSRHRRARRIVLLISM